MKRRSDKLRYSPTLREWSLGCLSRRTDDDNTRRHQFLPIVKCISMKMIVSIQQMWHFLSYTLSYVTYVPHNETIICESQVPPHHNSRQNSFFYVHWPLICWIQRTILCRTRCYHIVLLKHKNKLSSKSCIGLDAVVFLCIFVRI